MDDEGFIVIPRSIMRGPIWKDARPNHIKVFMTILENCAFSITKHNVNGHIFDIEPGQLCVTFRQLKEWCGSWITKNDVEGALRYFLRVNFLRQDLRHGKTIITITEPTIYKYCFLKAQTTSQTKVRQKSDIKEQCKQRKQEDNIFAQGAHDDSKISLLPEDLSDHSTKGQCNITYTNGQSKTNKNEKLISDKAKELLDYFNKSLINLIPEVGGTSCPPKDASHFDNLFEKYSPEEIKKVIQFSHSDDFWRGFVHSPSYLKKKFAKLFARMNRAKSEVTTNKPTVDRRTRNADGSVDADRYKGVLKI